MRRGGAIWVGAGGGVLKDAYACGALGGARGNQRMETGCTPKPPAVAHTTHSKHTPPTTHTTNYTHHQLHTHHRRYTTTNNTTHATTPLHHPSQQQQRGHARVGGPQPRRRRRALEVRRPLPPRQAHAAALHGAPQGARGRVCALRVRCCGRGRSGERVRQLCVVGGCFSAWGDSTPSPPRQQQANNTLSAQTFTQPNTQLPNGDVTSEQLRYLSGFLSRYAAGEACADVTTRANLQLRGVRLEDAGELLEGLKARGMSSIQVRRVLSRMLGVAAVGLGRRRGRVDCCGDVACALRGSAAAEDGGCGGRAPPPLAGKRNGILNAPPATPHTSNPSSRHHPTPLYTTQNNNPGQTPLPTVDSPAWTRCAT